MHYIGCITVIVFFLNIFFTAGNVDKFEMVKNKFIIPLDSIPLQSMLFLQNASNFDVQ